MVDVSFVSMIKALAGSSQDQEATNETIAIKKELSIDSDLLSDIPESCQQNPNDRDDSTGTTFNILSGAEARKWADETCWKIAERIFCSIENSVAIKQQLARKVQLPANVEKMMLQQQLLCITFSLISYMPLRYLHSLLTKIERSMLNIGTRQNIKKSTIWKDLYDKIGNPIAVDYTRRYECVEWYLALVHKSEEISLGLDPIPAISNLRANL